MEKQCERMTGDPCRGGGEWAQNWGVDWNELGTSPGVGWPPPSRALVGGRSAHTVPDMGYVFLIIKAGYSIFIAEIES